MSTITLPTYREVKVAIDTYAEAYESNNNEVVTDKLVDTIITALTAGCLQTRDYLMGLPYTYDLNTSSDIVSALAFYLPEGETRHLYTVIAGFAYEAGDTDKAVFLINLSLDEDKDYSLAQLLKRVVDAKWNKLEFEIMRQTCHPKLIVAMESDSTILN